MGGSDGLSVCRVAGSPASEPDARVDRGAVLPGLEVQVAAGRHAGGAGVGDDLPPADVPAGDDPARQVVVGGREVDAADDAVVEDELVAVAARGGLADGHDYGAGR